MGRQQHTGRRRWWRAIVAVAALAVAPAAAAIGASADPASQELARVNGEAVTMAELLHHLGTMHEGVGEAQVQPPDPLALLERIISVRLVVQEARAIGLDELPQVADQIEAVRRDLIKRAVTRERVKGIVEADRAEVERLYREAVREVEVASVLFPTVEAANAFRMSIEAGADFDFLAEKMIQLGKAERREAAQYLPARQLLPSVARAVDELEVGQVTPPISLGNRFTVVKLLGARLPDDPEARAGAEQQALAMRQELALAEYSQELRERYASPDRALIESLDYDSSDSSLAALRGDLRVLVGIRGGEPITVADLTARIQARFFHGIDRAIERRRVNDEIPGVLDRLILVRAVELEAERLGIEGRPSFQNALRAEEEAVLFSTFVSKVIDPRVELEVEELEAHYADHRAEFATPTMVRLDSLAFVRRDDAATALARLRQGSDMGWMREHTAGQADPSQIAEEWAFAGKLLSVPTLPQAAQDALAGAGEGDFRLCEQAGGPFHVLRVVEFFPPQPKAFEEVKREIAGKLFARKRQATLERWMGELRKASEVEVLVDGKGLEEFLGVGG